MPKSPSEILNDPQFRALPLLEQRQILITADPEFAKLTPSDQNKILQMGFVGGQMSASAAHPETFVSETTKQLSSWLTGMKNLLNLGGVGQPSALGTLGTGAVNALSGTTRELMGSPAPGKSALTAPTSWLGPISGRVPGAVSTLMGGDPAEARSRWQQGQKGAAVSAMYALPAMNYGISKLAEFLLPKGEPSPTKRALYLARAAGAEGKSVNIVDAFKVAMPDLMETQRLTGNTATSVDKLADLIADSGARTENEFALKMRPIANQQVVPISVADALKNEAKKFTTGAPEDEAIAKELNNAAATYQKPMTYANLNQIRMNARGRIHGFMGKKPTAQMAVTRTNADIIKDEIIHEAVRDIVYDAMENYYHAPGYFRALKRRQSAMLDLTDQMAGRLNELGNLKAFDSFMDRLRGHSYVSSGGHIGFATSNILAAPFSEVRKVHRMVKKGTAPASNVARSRALAAASATARQSQPSFAPDEEEQ